MMKITRGDLDLDLDLDLDKDFAFRGDASKVWTTVLWHEDGHSVSVSSTDEYDSHNQAVRKVVKKHYECSDDTHDSSSIIGSKEAQKLVNHDIKLGVIKVKRQDV